MAAVESCELLVQILNLNFFFFYIRRFSVAFGPADADGHVIRQGPSDFPSFKCSRSVAGIDRSSARSWTDCRCRMWSDETPSLQFAAVRLVAAIR